MSADNQWSADRSWNLISTHLRLRPDATIELLPVDDTFWQRIGAGQLGSFHNEYLITCHKFDADWPMWEMHPHGDEVVCLLSGSVEFELEVSDGTTRVSLTSPGSFAFVPKGTWHTARTKEECQMLFITAGEGTLHREMAP